MNPPLLRCLVIVYILQVSIWSCPWALALSSNKAPCAITPCTNNNDFSINRRHVIVTLTGASTTSAAARTASYSYALSPDEASRQYDTYASSYDQLDGGAASDLLGIGNARRDLLQQATGNVLEIGVGTGLNLDLYMGDNIKSLTLLDISDGMLRQAATRVERLSNLRGVPVSLMNLDATSELVKRFGPSSFDTVVDSFSLCVMGNVGARQCLEQMASVVKPETGRLLLLENSRSANPILGLYQDATADAAASLGGKGCLYNQNVRAMILSTKRLEILQEKSYASGLFRAFVCATGPS